MDSNDDDSKDDRYVNKVSFMSLFVTSDVFCHCVCFLITCHAYVKLRKKKKKKS